MKRALRVTLGRRTLARRSRGVPLRPCKAFSWRVSTVAPRFATVFLRWSPPGFLAVDAVRCRVFPDLDGSRNRQVYVVGFRVGNIEFMAPRPQHVYFPLLRLGAPRHLDRFDVRDLDLPRYVGPDEQVTLIVENRSRRTVALYAEIIWQEPKR